MSLEMVTDEIRKRLAGKTPVEKVIKLDLGDSGVVRVDGTAKPPLVDNENTPADCTLKVKMEHLERIVDGQINAQLAFMTGKIKVDGDMKVALEMGRILRS